MASNTFNESNATTKPPAYCHFTPTPLPPFFPPGGPAVLQGWARWTDLAPPVPADVAMYIPLTERPAPWRWVGWATMNRFTLTLTVERVTDPNPWRVSLAKRWNHLGHEVLEWYPVTVQFDPRWDTGLLTHITTPGYDFRHARITA